MIDKDLARELAEAAGETHWRRVAPLFELNEVSLNGEAAQTRLTAS